MKNTGSGFKKTAIEAARIGDSKHAENIAVYELAKNSTLADYAVLMTADSVPQLEAVEEAVSRAFKERGLYALYREGGRSRAWKVLDYGGVLVHIFEPRAREFYSMDALYAAFPKIEWREKEAGAKAAPKKAAAAKKAKPASVKKPAGKKSGPAKKTSPKK